MIINMCVMSKGESSPNACPYMYQKFAVVDVITTKKKGLSRLTERTVCYILTRNKHCANLLLDVKIQGDIRFAPKTSISRPAKWTRSLVRLGI